MHLIKSIKKKTIKIDFPKTKKNHERKANPVCVYASYSALCIYSK